MGVSGSGKTTVGRALAQALGWPFYDGDDFHPAANVSKMAAGLPLDDADRAPWLVRLRELIAGQLAADESAVLACSALKASYRQTLCIDNAQVRFIFLDGDFDTLWQRMSARERHFMRPELLASQFQTLEAPDREQVLYVPVMLPVEQQVARIIAALTPRAL